MQAQLLANGVFAIKRIYEPALPEDGYRVLVDRIWPRGMSKEHAGVDRWMKDVAPSVGLRTWFGHEPAKFAEFRGRYLVELVTNPGPIQELRALGREHPRVTLVYAAKDETHNHAQVLLEALSDLSEASPGAIETVISAPSQPGGDTPDPHRVSALKRRAPRGT